MMVFGFELPPRVQRLSTSPGGRDWLEQLPAHIEDCVHRWGLRLGRPYEQPQVSVVFPAITADGSSAVLKVQFPHPECRYEAEALRLWGGHGAVELFDCDTARSALLMERCEPGDHLSTV